MDLLDPRRFITDEQAAAAEAELKRTTDLGLQPDLVVAAILDAVGFVKLANIHNTLRNVRDAGPWRVADNGHRINSDDFTHDVSLTVGGDFADDTDRLEYSMALAKQLNYFNHIK